MEINEQEGLAWVPWKAQERIPSSGLEILLFIPDFTHSQDCVYHHLVRKDTESQGLQGETENPSFYEGQTQKAGITERQRQT